MTDSCIYCQADEQKTPLVSFSFQDNEYKICPQHLPFMIHNPDKLVGTLPGAEAWVAAMSDDPPDPHHT